MLCLNFAPRNNVKYQQISVEITFLGSNSNRPSWQLVCFDFVLGKVQKTFQEKKRAKIQTQHGSCQLFSFLNVVGLYFVNETKGEKSSVYWELFYSSSCKIES